MSQRLNNGAELARFLRSIEKFYIPTTTPVLDTISAPITADAAAVTVTTFASFASSDYVFVDGAGGLELNQLGTKPGSSAPIPVVRPFMLAQPAGAAIKKVTRQDLGFIEDAGGTFTTAASKTGIGAANSRAAIAYIDGDTPEQQFSFSLRESSLRNIATAYGADEDAIKGNGTTADPYRLLIGRSNIGSAANFCLRAKGLLVSGKTLNADIMNCFPEVNVSAQFVGKGSPTVWGVSVKFTDIVFWVSDT
jgi:hypothetical protein